MNIKIKPVNLGFKRDTPRIIKYPKKLGINILQS